MPRKVCLAALVLPFLLVAVASAQEPIVKIGKIRPNMSVFKESSRTKPIVMRSADEAAKQFSGDALAKLKEQVDFEKQIVLVFAWRGSGQDQMDFTVAESYPEQVRFRYKPGRTRDLRPHVYVYALRSNVTWSTK